MKAKLTGQKRTLETRAKIKKVWADRKEKQLKEFMNAPINMMEF